VTATRILLVSGSLRAASTNTAVLLTVAALAPDGVEATLYDGLGALPHFNPDDDVDPLPEEVVALRAAIAASDAVLFSTPEYAGALPGSFLNLLDWTIGGGEIYEKPVAWINVATSPTGAVKAYESLRTVLGYAGTRLVEAACAHIPVLHAAVGDDGLVADPDARGRVADILTKLVAQLRGS
jgi:NAD(P)H-dependent FMN reductase